MAIRADRRDRVRLVWTALGEAIDMVHLKNGLPLALTNGAGEWDC